MRNNKGFTIIEILAVVFIFSIMVSIAVPNYLQTLQDKSLEADKLALFSLNDATESLAIVQGVKMSEVLDAEEVAEAYPSDYDKIDYLVQNGFIISIPYPETTGAYFAWDSTDYEWVLVCVGGSKEYGDKFVLKNDSGTGVITSYDGSTYTLGSIADDSSNSDDNDTSDSGSDDTGSDDSDTTNSGSDDSDPSNSGSDDSDTNNNESDSTNTDNSDADNTSSDENDSTENDTNDSSTGTTENSETTTDNTETDNTSNMGDGTGSNYVGDTEDDTSTDNTDTDNTSTDNTSTDNSDTSESGTTDSGTSTTGTSDTGTTGTTGTGDVTSDDTGASNDNTSSDEDIPEVEFLYVDLSGVRIYVDGLIYRRAEKVLYLGDNPDYYGDLYICEPKNKKTTSDASLIKNNGKIDTNVWVFVCTICDEQLTQFD